MAGRDASPAFSFLATRLATLRRAVEIDTAGSV